MLKGHGPYPITEICSDSEGRAGRGGSASAFVKFGRSLLDTDAFL